MIATRLYNPHGSDVTALRNIAFDSYERLYNPHGSDVTFESFGYETDELYFITHTVQM